MFSLSISLLVNRVIFTCQQRDKDGEISFKSKLIQVCETKMGQAYLWKGAGRESGSEYNNCKLLLLDFLSELASATSSAVCVTCLTAGLVVFYIRHATPRRNRR